MRSIVLARILGLLIVPALSVAPATAQTREDTRRMLPELHLLDFPWVTPTIHRESILLLQNEDGGPLVGRLAFPAEEVIDVRSADGQRTLKAGSDFQLGAEKRTLVFPADADVPFVRTRDLFPPLGSPNSYAHRAGHPEQAMLYHAGKWFHERQFEVTYRRPQAAWLEPAPSPAEKQLPRTLARLKAGEPLTIVIAGDSITAGGDASGLSDVSPHMPAFPELVAAQLEATYGSTVTLKNLAVGGTSVHNGVTDFAKYVAEQPDLLIIGFGMNDVGRRDPDWFQTETRTLIAQVKAERPDVEILLLAPMIGNAEWVHTPREMFPRYRDKLAELTGPGIALADLTAVWAMLLEHKHDFDMIGNGLNHPNDFGHRVYAQAILGLLVAPPNRDKSGN